MISPLHPNSSTSKSKIQQNNSEIDTGFCHDALIDYKLNKDKSTLEDLTLELDLLSWAMKHVGNDKSSQPLLPSI
ncbi:hypothetical protein HOG98_09690 [bacterium]|jgi:hypothetical protein|nr:hypothetical protein [bacterium]